jgi:hypothetical protein
VSQRARLQHACAGQSSGDGLCRALP